MAEEEDGKLNRTPFYIGTMSWPHRHSSSHTSNQHSHDFPGLTAMKKHVFSLGAPVCLRMQKYDQKRAHLGHVYFAPISPSAGLQPSGSSCLLLEHSGVPSYKGRSNLRNQIQTEPFNHIFGGTLFTSIEIYKRYQEILRTSNMEAFPSHAPLCIIVIVRRHVISNRNNCPN